MNKYLKLGLGLIATAGAAHIVYHGYQEMADNLRRDLTDAVRTHFSDKSIKAVWIFDDPDVEAIFKGGVIVSDENISDSSVKNISFEIDAKTLVVTEFEESSIDEIL
ncbi:hypothetical protein ACFO26_00450 [Lactococcus nasutitermitis]|uniref:Small secreted protein n=1 Tax=Lactococcus nasutitermitis TaxID=1652957 RepID=A0ABV9JA48_9LACT|nr:hypothetical protein [Lactococcus nasutitermitis]